MSIPRQFEQVIFTDGTVMVLRSCGRIDGWLDGWRDDEGGGETWLRIPAHSVRYCVVFNVPPAAKTWQCEAAPANSFVQAVSIPPDHLYGAQSPRVPPRPYPDPPTEPRDPQP